ncbi:MAG: hypothetical protein R3E39_13960 [Anaerolineae bacterium]
MDFYDALQAISRPIRAVDYARSHSLDAMHALMKALGNPEQAFPAVVVAGSVGKGTVCQCLANRLATLPLKVGLYTSPHLHSFRERFVIDRQMISQPEFAGVMKVIREASDASDERFSTFELATALALWWFREQAVDVAVLEVGIGGRWDAVNVVPNKLSIVTPIEMEHVAMLGGTLHSIAEHKAGIMKLGGYAISAEQVPEVAQVLQDEAEARGTELAFSSYDELADMALSNLAERQLIPQNAAYAGCIDKALPGRMEWESFSGKQVLIDGAHTRSGAARLQLEIERRWGNEPILIVVGMLRDKYAAGFLTTFDVPNYQLVLTQSSSQRATPVKDLQKAIKLKHAHVQTEPDLNQALQYSVKSDMRHIVITGSLRIAAAAREFLGLLDTDLLAEARATRDIFEGDEYVKRLKSGDH